MRLSSGIGALFVANARARAATFSRSGHQHVASGERIAIVPQPSSAAVATADLDPQSISLPGGFLSKSTKSHRPPSSSFSSTIEGHDTFAPFAVDIFLARCAHFHCRATRLLARHRQRRQDRGCDDRSPRTRKSPPRSLLELIQRGPEEWLRLADRASDVSRATEPLWQKTCAGMRRSPRPSKNVFCLGRNYAPIPP
mgnify:CR=1 FL=1